MAFEATKKEWSELYAFFRLLADGQVKTESQLLKVAKIQREEHDGTRQYIIGKTDVHIIGEKVDKCIPREYFGEAADAVFAVLKSSSDLMVESPEGIEEFLDDVAIFDLEAKTEDRTDFHISFFDADAPLVGFCVRSKIGGMNPLLDGGRTANLKFEMTGIKFATPTVSKVNALETPNGVADRMMMIERLGGILKYADVADRVFRCNLSMIDLHFPRMLAEMVRIMHLDGITKINELTERIKVINPLKIKDELIGKHGFYEYKMRQFLMALALGMRPAKIFNGTDSAVSGYLFVDSDGEMICYQKGDKKEFEDFLFNNTRLEKGDTEKDKYGYLEKENGVLYFKLNVKIGFLKR